MTATKLKTPAPFISAESLSSKFAASATLATAGATIPTNTGDIWVYPSAACHWNPGGTATSSFMHTVAANEPFKIDHKFIATAEVIGDAGAIDVTLVYMRGARAGKAVSGDTTRPY